MPKDAYDARNEAERLFAQNNPEPVVPAVPEPVHRGNSSVIKHEKGMIYLEMLPSNFDRFGNRTPYASIGLVISDSAYELKHDLAAMRLLQSEVNRVVAELEKATADFEAYQEAKRQYHDVKNEWDEAQNKAGRAAFEAWEAEHPDEEDSDDDDE